MDKHSKVVSKESREFLGAGWFDPIERRWGIGFVGAVPAPAKARQYANPRSSSYTSSIVFTESMPLIPPAKRGGRKREGVVNGVTYVLRTGCQWRYIPKDLPPRKPVLHRTDAAIRGHIGCTFLALLLRKELLDRLVAHRAPMPEWQHMIDDLLDLSIVEVEQDGRRAILRTAPRPRSDLPRDRAHIAAQGDADRPDNPRSRLIGVVPKNLMH